MAEDEETEGPAEIDWFLQVLVRIANSGAAKIPITLDLGGILVTGYLVGGATYFRGVAGTMGEMIEDSETREVVELAFRSLATKYPDPDAELNEDDTKELDKESDDVQFLHVENARYFVPGQDGVPTNQGVWWRGRIGAVVGFNIGELREGPPGPP